MNPSLRVLRVALYERPVTLRLPFRFGAATVTHCPQAFVQIEAEVGGRRVEGATAELMVPKWFDKNPALTHEQNFEQLRASLRLAADAWRGAEAASPWVGSTTHGESAIERGVTLGLPRLAAQFGAAQLDKAVADAALRAAGLGWVDGLRAGVLGDPWSTRLPLHHPEDVLVRHTVGLADRLRADEPGPDPHDGLPATLEDAITHYGLRCFKLKLCGELERDLARLQAIAALLDDRVGDTWQVTLDGNETFADAAALGRFWHAFVDTPALRRLRARTLLLEQPIARARALEEPIDALGITLPVILDESDDRADAFERGLAGGYRGISSKACKGLYRSLHSAARVAREPQRLLLSGEDLTCQAGLAVQQDTLLAATLGVAHIERNGHHYVDGFGVAPDEEARAFAAAHPGLYAEHGGRVRLRVHDGRLDLRSLHVEGFASAAQPAWSALRPMH